MYTCKLIVCHIFFHTRQIIHAVEQKTSMWWYPFRATVKYVQNLILRDTNQIEKEHEDSIDKHAGW